MTIGKRQIEGWLSDIALPFWSTVGVDAQAGGFVERLLPDGTPDFEASKRSMVQARQIYVFSCAAHLGLLPNSVAVAERGLDFLLRHACPDGAANGFVHTVDRNGHVVDPVRDTYDHAFLLLAFSWFYRETRREDARRAINDVAVAIELLRHPSGVGYAEGSSAALPRRQNPHMHLLEAYLAAFEATGREDMLDKAASILGLFTDFFFDRRLTVLREFFTDDLKPALAPDGDIVEPGHHCEWIWLLDKYCSLNGLPPDGTMQALYETAAKAIDPQTSLVFDEIWADGSLKRASKRLWPQTEAIKAEIIMGRRAGRDSTERVNALLDGIFHYFLNRPVAGTWNDRIDERNKPTGGTTPASSLYHILSAVSEVLGAP